jgi:uncharacterized protein YndB with AHSA1/START domain
MKMKTIKNALHINASKEKVWDVLTNDHYTRQWYAAFKEGSHAVTDWQKGSKAQFLDADGNGMEALIDESKPGELLSIEYTGLVINGRENFDSDMAEKYKGGREIYRLLEVKGKTRLDVEADMDESMYEMMAESWKKACKKIIELAEN